MKKQGFVSVSEMRLIDKKAIKYGIPVELMMENVGRAIAVHIKNKFPNIKNKIICIAGKGNNGGGVISAARHLTCYNAKVDLILLYPKKLMTAPSQFHLFLTRKNPNITVITLTKTTAKRVLASIYKADTVIDGIFGTGFSGNIKEPISSIISTINHSKAYVVSNDVPSGIDADTGKIGNVAVKADFVIVLHRPKRWMKNKISMQKFSIENIGIPPFFDSLN